MSAMSALLSGPTMSPNTTQFNTLTEAEQKERAVADRLDKRGTIMAGTMRKFIKAYSIAREAMMAEERAAKALAAAGKGKKKKATAAKGDGKKTGGDDKKKKVKTTPVQDAWISFFADLDERINKQKRCNLEDLYRGVAKLDGGERRLLACIVMASNNKKVLPLEGMNANALNIRESLFASVAAFDAPVDKALLSSSSGINYVMLRGASNTQLLQHGFAEEDLERIGRRDASTFEERPREQTLSSMAVTLSLPPRHHGSTLRSLCTSYGASFMPPTLEGTSSKMWQETLAAGGGGPLQRLQLGGHGGNGGR